MAVGRDRASATLLFSLPGARFHLTDLRPCAPAVVLQVFQAELAAGQRTKETIRPRSAGAERGPEVP